MTDDLDRMREQAERLAFDVSEDVLGACLRSARQLSEGAADLRLEPTEDGDRARSAVTPTAQGSLLATYEEPRRERTDGRLSEYTVAVKDNVAVAGLPLTCGSTEFGFTPDNDAVVVERLLGGGASIRGKANMDAFAFGPSGEFSDYGPVSNPIDSERVPGGSSSGSGAAVAMGEVDVALGSDTGGSVRIPAACCGVVGAKPTHGLVPRHGFVGFAPSLDTIGPLARSVEDAARTLHAIAGPDLRDPTASERRLPEFEAGFSLDDSLSVGLPDAFFERSDDTVSEAVHDAVTNVEAADVTSVDLPLGAVEQAYFLIGASEFVWYLDQNGTTRGQGTDYSEDIRRSLAAVKDRNLGEHVARRLLPSAYLDDATEGRSYLAARQEAVAFQDALRGTFESVDVLVLPTLRVLPPERGQMDTTEDMLTLLGNTAPFNLARTPAVSVPVAQHEGLPISAQVVAPRFEDLKALAVAQRLEMKA